MIETDTSERDRPESAAWRTHDFRAGVRQMTAAERGRLGRAHRRAARTLSAALSVFLRRRVDVRLEEIASCDGEELGAGGPRPDFRVLESTTPDDALALRLDGALLPAMVESLLGSGAIASHVRPLTRLETNLAAGIVDRFVAALNESWNAALLALADARGAAPLLAGLRTAHHLTRVRWSVEFSGATGAVAWYHAPGPLLDRLARESSPHDHDEDSPAACRERLLERLASLKLTLAAALLTRPVPLASLLSMQPGDLIDTGVPVDASIEVTLAGRPLPGARLGASESGKTAVLLVSS